MTVNNTNTAILNPAPGQGVQRSSFNSGEYKNNATTSRDEEGVFKDFGDEREYSHDDGDSWLNKIYNYLIKEDDSLVSAGTKKALDFFIKKLPMIAAEIATYSNIAGAFLELSPIPKSLRKTVESVITWITKLSFIPYGAQGIVNGLRKNNLVQAIAFLGEPIFAFMGNLKTIYLLRGFATGADQLPVATEKITEKKFGKVFPDMKTGVIETGKAIVQLLTEMLSNPFETLFNTKSTGHMALLSSIGDMISTVGFLATGKEKIFGPLRDISAFAFDWEMLLSEKPLEKKAGAFFILEQFLDYFARFVPERLRLFTNMLSHASGRKALQFYVGSYSEDYEKSKSKNKHDTPERKSIEYGLGLKPSFEMKNLDAKSAIKSQIAREKYQRREFAKTGGAK